MSDTTIARADVELVFSAIRARSAMDSPSGAYITASQGLQWLLDPASIEYDIRAQMEEWVSEAKALGLA